MRVTNRTKAADSLMTIERRSQQYAKEQAVITSGKRVDLASDDPSGSARILKLRSSLARNLQFQRNLDTAKMRLGHAELSLQRVTEQLGESRSFAVQAANGNWSQEDRTLLAQEVDQLLESLAGEGNRRFLGNSLYVGSQVDKAPFDVLRDAAGRIDSVSATRMGQEGRIMVQLSENEELQVNFRGVDVFMGGRPGGTADVFDALVDLRDGLLLGNPEAAGKSLERIDAAIATVNATRAALGTRFQRVEAVETQLFSREQTLTENLSTEEDADLAQAMMRFTLEQTGYQAALQSISKVMNTSLLNFLAP